MPRKPYPTDLTDQQWEILKPLIPPAKPGGCPRRVNMLSIINAIFYILASGCAWRLMPHDLPPTKNSDKMDKPSKTTIHDAPRITNTRLVHFVWVRCNPLGQQSTITFVCGGLMAFGSR